MLKIYKNQLLGVLQGMGFSASDFKGEETAVVYWNLGFAYRCDLRGSVAHDRKNPLFMLCYGTRLPYL
jgi:hypothetical protein